MGDRASFEITNRLAAFLSLGIIILNMLGFWRGSEPFATAAFVMSGATMFAVWALEERVKEIEKEMKRQ